MPSSTTSVTWGNTSTARTRLIARLRPRPRCATTSSRSCASASRRPSTSSRTCARSATRSRRRSCPQRPGLELAAAFVPAAEQVSGDFYLVAEGPQDSTAAGHRRRRRAWPAGRAPGRVRADRVRRHRAVLRRSVAAAELGEHRAGRARGHQHGLRHRGLHDLPAGREAPALGLRRPSAGAVDPRRPRARRAASRARRSGSARIPSTSRDRCGPRTRRACCSTPTG